jgi:hypothetical protein
MSGSINQSLVAAGQKALEKMVFVVGEVLRNYGQELSSLPRPFLRTADLQQR